MSADSKRINVEIEYDLDLLELAVSEHKGYIADLRAALSSASFSHKATALIAAAHAKKASNVAELVQHFDPQNRLWPELQIFVKAYAMRLGERDFDAFWQTVSAVIYKHARARFNVIPRAIPVLDPAPLSELNEAYRLG